MKQLELFVDPQSNVETVESFQWKMFIDGAARNNPGPAGAGIYILKDNQVFAQHGFFLGSKTNNQAEYLALLLGLLLLKPHVRPADAVHIVSDSQLLVRQIQGAYKVKNELLKPLHDMAKKLLSGIQYDIAHVMREENSNADALANNGIDKKVLLKQEEIGFLREHKILL